MINNVGPFISPQIIVLCDHAGFLVTKRIRWEMRKGVLEVASGRSYGVIRNKLDGTFAQRLLFDKSYDNKSTSMDAYIHILLTPVAPTVSESLCKSVAYICSRSTRKAAHKSS